MSPMEADCSALIAAGWGSHNRDLIPANWQRVKGPDEIPGVRPPAKRVYRRDPILEAEIEGAILTPQSDKLPQRTKNGRRLPLDKWQHRRALYLARKQSV